MRARALQGGACAFVLVACGCQPSETVAADNQTDENPSCDCIEVQHDNPVLTEDVLLVEQPFGESATRADGEQWAYTSFDTEVDVSGAPLLYIVAAGNDAFSPSSSTGQQLLHTWPTSDGQWTPAPNPVQMPWELHGSRFGYFTSAVRVSKVRANSATVLASNATRFRVASNVLIVPIQAILVLPEYPKPEYEAIMRATFGAEEQGVLWTINGERSARGLLARAAFSARFKDSGPTGARRFNPRRSSEERAIPSLFPTTFSTRAASSSG